MSTDVSRDKKLVYRFDEGDASMGVLLGGKGSNLCEMVRLGLPVPPGFVISTEACLDYFALGHQLPAGLLDSVRENVRLVERSLGRTFGSPDNPLLVSVRSGSRFSMPGMMDTILNLGINDEVVQGLASMMGDARPAYDAYRRFLQIYADVVLEVDLHIFEEILASHKERAGVTQDYELTSDALRAVVADFKAAIKKATGAKPPADPWQQLAAAVEAVFRSWNNDRAIFYRNHNGISHDMGTAVTIQAMVFGNQGPTSATGVLFTRNPANGERKIYGEFLPNAQGEDVVAGVRTPEKIGNLAGLLPEASTQLMDLAGQLEVHYRDVQDIEFTIETGRLFILQTRSGKRTPLASVTSAVQMVKEGLIGREDALLRVNPEEVVQLLVPQFKVDVNSGQARSALMAQGSGASPGAATGKAYFDATRAASAAEDAAVILVRPETKPDDIHGIAAAAGVVTSRGGATSHAAVVTRGMGKPCIVGCEAIKVDLERRVLVAGGRTVHEGESISMDGTTGNVFLGEMETLRPALEDIPEAIELLGWADEARKLGVWANADTPTDATQALALGAEGIGLCRTEHMFLDLQRLPAVRRMLLSAEAGEQWRQEHPELTRNPLGTPGLPPDVESFFGALAEVLQLQTDDFTQILRAMGSRPVIIRLLDAPLHEFLPAYDTLLAEVVEMRTRGTSTADELRDKETFLSLVGSLREENPMLGHRGCRLGLTFPAIYEMQVEAIITAGANLVKEGLTVHPEIMIPMTVHVEEMIRLRRSLTALATWMQERLGVTVPYKFGTMIETPRGAITAGDIARESDFFSFGTNDLTQMAFGFSRDDAEGKFLRAYVGEGILPADPFATVDTDGVGALIRMAVSAGRQARPGLEIGICGEHGGDPASVRFCHHAGLDYVSCSPFRVPVARLAAAQAALSPEEG